MEEEMLSMISSGEMNVNEELSDSTSRAHSFSASKCLRPAVSIISSTKFKGVVPQQNGNWGAQIYANHQRIWLGTFKSEKEAAMAYDSAAIRLRSSDSHRNFPWTNITVEEPYFQSHYSTEALLNMIRDGSYGSKFSDFLGSQSKYVERDISLTPVRGHENGWLMCRQLFQKELTPSDVGKLNRLVIPKKYAVKYFPQFSGCEVESAESDKADNRQLVFYDRLMRMWTFRYCYWRSSQSFVFTRGWNRFVKENQLKTNDTIAFYICEGREKTKVTKTFCMIDVNKGEHHGAPIEVSTQYIGMQVDLQVQSGQSVGEGGEKVVEEEELVEPSPMCHSEPKPFKLFGVQIL